MKMMPLLYKTVFSPKRKFESYYMDRMFYENSIRGGIHNYQGKLHATTKMFHDRMESPKGKYGSQKPSRPWRDRQYTAMKKQHRMNLYRFEQQRSVAYKHHFTPVMYESQDAWLYGDFKEKDKIELWCRENAKGLWHLSMEVFEAGDPINANGDAIVMYRYVIWLDNQDDVLLCRLSLS